MRSQQLLNFVSSLSKLNKLLSFIVFEQDVVEDFYKDLVLKHDDSCKVGDIYNGKHSSQFNIGLLEFEDEMCQSLRMLFSNIFVMMYTNFDTYIKDLFFFANRCSSSLREDNTLVSGGDSRGFLKKFEDWINLSTCSFVVQQEFWTLSYFRARRNAIVHRYAESDSKGEYLKYSKDKGGLLNNFWKNHELIKVDFDFRKNDSPYVFSAQDLVDSFVLLRRIAEKIDKDVLMAVGNAKLIIDSYRRYLSKISKKQHAPWSNQKGKEKFKRFLKIELDMDEDVDQIDGIITGM